MKKGPDTGILRQPLRALFSPYTAINVQHIGPLCNACPVKEYSPSFNTDIKRNPCGTNLAPIAIGVPF